MTALYPSTDAWWIGLTDLGNNDLNLFIILYIPSCYLVTYMPFTDICKTYDVRQNIIHMLYYDVMVITIKSCALKIYMIEYVSVANILLFIEEEGTFDWFLSHETGTSHQKINNSFIILNTIV